MTPQRRSLVYQIKQLELALRPRFHAACAAAGMTAAQYTALTVLERRPGISGSELARRSFVRPQTMAGIIDPLVDGGLVSRDPGPGRQILLRLTDAGTTTLARLDPQVAGVEELMLADFDEEEREVFATLLRRARRSLDEQGHRPA
ncbi:MarR family transcriptional regulator [Microbacterium sp. cx-55]|uniref:MarR family winged helix-turn-helix transcriptional regulator n=1 Tax=Microbacterium sp. cx-55 TaxID=2875948 RepID=UPI001CBBA4C5|nr:MarR family transcriptional regulator [Microbacterium sp. cx-55]MBZ4488387.1 MarR family transcriptional regulator [Microbacterium sp. cx-55]UGB35039.1 MarR family transcriptional regulator [Microbacterium sp. cx-55]